MTTRNREGEQAKARRPSLLGEVLERRMLLYALAAGAALTGVSPAQAKVIFTPSSVVVKGTREGQNLQIDLNHDGVADFDLTAFLNSTDGDNWLTLKPEQKGNAVAVTVRNSEIVAALNRGNTIGSSARFADFGFLITSNRGKFFNTTKRFAGVEFLINGQVHYGWIGFRSVTVSRGIITAALGGWAYETEPNTPIIAGDTGTEDSDSAALTMAEPTSLELLATGHVAVAERRRRIAG